MTLIPKLVREDVQWRSGGVCEFPGCTAGATANHHRKMRSQGGKNVTSNIMALCTEHHGYIHEHPAESYANGWLVRSWDEAS